MEPPTTGRSLEARHTVGGRDDAGSIPAALTDASVVERKDAASTRQRQQVQLLPLAPQEVGLSAGPWSYTPQRGVQLPYLLPWSLGLSVDDATLSRWKDGFDSRRDRIFLA